jgi:hypothetical protein
MVSKSFFCVLQISVKNAKCPAVFKVRKKNVTFLTMDTNILTLAENIRSSRTAVNWPITKEELVSELSV